MTTKGADRVAQANAQALSGQVGGAQTKSGQIVSAGGKVVGGGSAKDAPSYQPGMDSTDRFGATNQVGPITQMTNELNKAVSPTDQAPQDLVNQVTQAQTQIASLAKQKGVSLQQNPQGGYSAIPDLNTQAKQAHQTLQQSGMAPAVTPGAGSAMVNKATVKPQTEPETQWNQVYELDPKIDSIFTEADDYYSPPKQKQSLLEEYKALSDSLGIGKLNEELIDAKRIIEGTEDDIRNEITAAGGFATDSQVMAMANARNKSLIKNYNYLLEMKQSATTQLSTMMQLSVQDRQFAEAEFDRKMNFAFKVQEFKERATTNARTSINSFIDNVTKMGGNGYATLYQAAAGNPTLLKSLEKLLGVPGGLAQAALIAPAKNYGFTNVDGTLYRTDPKTGEVVAVGGKNFGGGEGGSLSMVKKQNNVQQILDLTQSPALDSTVGTSFLSRAPSGAGGVLGRIFGATATGAAVGGGAGLAFGGLGAIPGALIGGAAGLVGGTALALQGAKDKLSGQRQEFLGGVEQLRSQLNLDTLINAKASGATFGALSNQELQVLATAGTRLGTYALTDKEGKILGYNTSEAGFKREMDKISKYARLDYILKGGEPSEVGVQVLPDGTYWMMNSFGKLEQVI